MAVVGRDMLLRLDTSNANDRNLELMINNEKTNDDLPVDENGPPSGPLGTIIVACHLELR